MQHASSNLAKHQTRNPIVRTLLDRYFSTLLGIVEPLRPARILDVGCGEGVTAARLGALPFAFEYLGVDLDGEAVAYASSRVSGRTFRQGSVFELGDERADLVVCLEVLEHLTDPDAGVAALKRAATRDLVVSVPWEPWFRLGNLARAKYLARLGNHPEHLQQFSPESIGELVARHVGPVTITTSFPWVFVHARVTS
jgi:SAM-dependent methyltransferase